MAEQLFALKKDVDELIEDMQQLKRSYNTVDFIAHTVKNLWDEQQCQSAQMRRIEERLAAIENEQRGQAAQTRRIEERLAAIENEQRGQAAQMRRIEGRLDVLEANVGKIVKHLGIQ